MDCGIGCLRSLSTSVCFPRCAAIPTEFPNDAQRELLRQGAKRDPVERLHLKMKHKLVLKPQLTRPTARVEAEGTIPKGKHI